MTRYTMPLSGGCYSKSGFVSGDIIHGFKFNWKTIHTSAGDCVFANFIKDCQLKVKRIRDIRKELKLKDGDICVEDVEIIAKYFDCHLKLWINTPDEIRFEEFNIGGKFLSR